MNAPAPKVLNLDDADGSEIQVGIEQLGVAAAEINQQIATARRFPRSIQRFRESLLTQVTLTEQIAGSCIYALPRGGKTIEGPSIRFAEMAMSAWGNCRAIARIVGETENFIIAQGIFMDLERNIAVGMEVNRRIIDSEGRRFNIDMIGVTGAAAAAIALRNAILRGIPKAMYWDAYEAAKKTVAGKLSTLSDKRNRAVEAFKPYGITEQQILAKLGKQGLVEIGATELITLHGFLTSIQEGEADPEEIFPPAEAKGAPTRKAAPKQPADHGEKSPPGGKGGAAGGGVDSTTSSKASPPADQSEPPPPSELEEGVAQALLDCRTDADCDGVRKLFQKEILDAPPEIRARIEILITQRKETLASRQPEGGEVADDDLFPGDRPPPGGR